MKKNGESSQSTSVCILSTSFASVGSTKSSIEEMVKKVLLEMAIDGETVSTLKELSVSLSLLLYLPTFSGEDKDKEEKQNQKEMQKDTSRRNQSLGLVPQSMR